MSKSKKILPELRFPEFKDSGEWEVKKIEDVLDYERPDNYIVSDTDYQKEGIPVLTANKSFILGYTHEGFGIYENLPAVIFDDFTVDSKYVDFPFKVKSSAIKILTPKKEDNLKFIYELISQIKFDAREHKRYYISEYQQIKIPIPTIQEQQRIASCLSSLDEVIEAHSKKLELLKDHKKGLMQNLFPQDGEKVPKLRFKEFENSGEWEEDMVDNLVSTITPPKKITSSNYQKYGKFPIIDQSKNYYCGWTNDNEAVITEDLPLIIFGDHTCVIKIAKKPFAQGADGIKILKTKDKIFPEYLFHYLCHNEVVMEDYKRHYSILKDKVIVFPNINSGEQQKIASCLSSLDEVIEAQTEAIEQLKLHKKGLMQGLFPKISD
jgi:type I restriction enzyme S subunit